MQNLVTRFSSGDTDTEVARIKSELARRFAGVGGSMARGCSFAALFPSVSAEIVEEALQRLWEEGLVESHCLGDGALAYHFPRR